MKMADLSQDPVFRPVQTCDEVGTASHDFHWWKPDCLIQASGFFFVGAVNV